MSLHLLAITPGRGFDAEAWRAVLRCGPDGFLIREPQMETAELLSAARWCRATAPGVELWVKGRLDVALAAECGLHAGEGHPAVPPGLTPCSYPLHAPPQAASRWGARQLLLSPIQTVPGKGEPWGVPRLHAFLDGLPPGGPRILALGGLTPEALPALRHPRLTGIAAIRALWDSSDPAEAVRALRAAWGL